MTNNIPDAVAPERTAEFGFGKAGLAHFEEACHHPVVRGPVRLRGWRESVVCDSWFMAYDLWSMVYDFWFMISGFWFLVSGSWFMVYG